MGVMPSILNETATAETTDAVAPNAKKRPKKTASKTILVKGNEDQPF